MSLVCIGSVRGAPGASTLAVLAAACWPRPVALIEADPAGGALAVRYRLGRTPGLAGLASLVRHGAEPDVLWQHAQMLPGDLPVVVAPESGEVTAGILRDCAAHMAAWFTQLEDVDIIVDCGRLAYRDVHWPLCQAADETLVVARPRAEELYPAAHRLRAMGEDVASVGMVLIGDRPHSPSEITSQLGVQVRGVVADDAWAAGVLTVGGRSRGLRRSSLVRSVRSLVDDLMYRLETPVLESGQRATGALTKGAPALTRGAAALPRGPFTTDSIPVGASTGESHPIVLPPPVPVTAPVGAGAATAGAPAAAAAAAAGMPTAPAPVVGPSAMPAPATAPAGAPASQTRSGSGLPPAYLQRSRDSAARRQGGSRRDSGQYPPVQAPPPPAYAPARNAPPPPRPRTGSPRTGGTGVAPARPGNSGASRSRSDRSGSRRWGRER